MIKKLLKIFINKIINHRKKRENSFIKKLLEDNKFRLLDVGGAGGIQKRWILFADNMEFIFFECHKELAAKLKAQGHKVITKAAWSQKLANLKFFNAKKPECSGLLEPNFKHLDFFSNSERFKIINTGQVESTTIDHEFDEKNFPYFIKLDTEGSELEILKGGNRVLDSVLGLEIECSFNQLRENQPKFEEIKSFLETKKIQFVDFFNLRRWERKSEKFENNKYGYTGQPQFFDALFTVSPETIVERYISKKINKSALKYYITILFVFNRSDLLKTLTDLLGSDNLPEFHLGEAYQLTKKQTKKINLIRKINEFFMLFVREKN